MATIIQQRRGTAAEWTAVNTILANGEKGLETDGLGTTEVKEKIGNGVLAWNDLPYQESGAVASVSGDGVNNTDPKNPVLSFPDTSEVTETTDKKYVTDAEKVVISNTSGTNTGDETISTIQTKRPIKTVNNESLEGVGNIEISGGGGSEPFSLSAENPNLSYVVKEGVWKPQTGNSNLLLDANDFSTVNWIKLGVTVSTDVAVSPSGDSDSDQITVDSANSVHQIRQGTTPSNQDTQSIYVKYNGSTQFIQMHSGVTVVEYANFDIKNGLIESQGTTDLKPLIQDIGNGWFRCSVTLQISGVCNYLLANSGSMAWAGGYQGNGTDNLLVWFAKVENGDKVTGGVETISNVSTEAGDYQNRKSLSEYLKKYKNKEVDENNQLNIVMIGDSIFGRQDAVDGLDLAPNQAIGEFPPNMIYQNIAYNLLNRYQYNNADAQYINLESTKWTQSGTWVKTTGSIDNVNTYESNTPSDYLEITVTGAKFFKLVFTTMSFKTTNGLNVTINGVLPSSLGITGLDSLNGLEGDIKWANSIWSGLNEGTSYTFRFTKASGTTSSIWGCETWSKPRLNIINSGFGGFTSTEQNQFIKFAQNTYYKADLIIYEMPVINDSFGLTSFGGNIVSPTSSRVGGTTENYFVKASSDGVYANFDNIELKKGELAQIKSGVYVLGSDKYDESLLKYITGLDSVLNAQANLNIPLLCSTVHLTQYIQNDGRFWGVDYLEYSRFKATQKDTAFVDVYNYCVDNEIDPNTITSDTTHINPLGVETWITVLKSALDLDFTETNGGAKKVFKDSGFVDSGDSRTVTFPLEHKTAPKISISQIGANNIFISSTSTTGFVADGAGVFNWESEAK